GGEGRDFLPWHAFILTQLLGCGSQASIAGRPAVGSGNGFGQVMQYHVLAAATDVGAALRFATQDGFIGEAAVSGDDKMAGGGCVATQDFEQLEGFAVEVLLFER